MAPSSTFKIVLVWAAVRSSGSPAPPVVLPFIVSVATLASFALVTASSAIVRAPEPVTSPVCVALVSFAVLRPIAASMVSILSRIAFLVAGSEFESHDVAL